MISESVTDKERTEIPFSHTKTANRAGITILYWSIPLKRNRFRWRRSYWIGQNLDLLSVCSTQCSWALWIRPGHPDLSPHTKLTVKDNSYIAPSESTKTPILVHLIANRFLLTAKLSEHDPQAGRWRNVTPGQIRGTTQHNQPSWSGFLCKSAIKATGPVLADQAVPAIIVEGRGKVVNQTSQKQVEKPTTKLSISFQEVQTIGQGYQQQYHLRYDS